MRKVEGEVHDAAAGGRQVGLVEEDAEEEALHDGGRGEGEQEKEEDERVAVVQHPSSLRGQRHKCKSAYSALHLCRTMYVEKIDNDTISEKLYTLKLLTQGFLTFFFFNTYCMNKFSTRGHSSSTLDTSTGGTDDC